MNLRMTVVATGVMALWLAGCSATGGASADGRVGAVLDVGKALTVSEDELKNASLQLRAADDKKARVAAGNNKYALRHSGPLPRRIRGKQDAGVIVITAQFRQIDVNRQVRPLLAQRINQPSQHHQRLAHFRARCRQSRLRRIERLRPAI